jgi:hypothetical protein
MISEKPVSHEGWKRTEEMTKIGSFKSKHNPHIIYKSACVKDSLEKSSVQFTAALAVLTIKFYKNNMKYYRRFQMLAKLL